MVLNSRKLIFLNLKRKKKYRNFTGGVGVGHRFGRRNLMFISNLSVMINNCLRNYDSKLVKQIKNSTFCKFQSSTFNPDQDEIT